MSNIRNAGKMSRGVWSAAPTPFTGDMDIDVVSVRRMVSHHLRLGVKGLFLLGTNGEGPWMTAAQRWKLMCTVVRCVDRRVPVTVQVTDNSAARILDNIHIAARAGADMAVIAPPYMPPRNDPDVILALYRDAIRESPLPVGIYDRRMADGGLVPDAVMQEVLAEKKVVMLKDSSMSRRRMRQALAAKRRRPNLLLFNGWEFNCVPYLKAGYDGLMLGGGSFNGYIARQILAAADDGEWKRAQRLQLEMNRIMFAIYGGRRLSSWLAGEKYLLMRLGVFRTWRNHPDYPLTDACRHAVEQVLRKHGEYLLP